MLGVDVEPHHVDGFALPGHGDFDTGDEPDAMPVGGGGSFRQSGRGVMIGQAQLVNADGGRAGHQFLGGVSAVGNTRMGMQIIDPIRLWAAFAHTDSSSRPDAAGRSLGGP